MSPEGVTADEAGEATYRGTRPLLPPRDVPKSIVIDTMWAELTLREQNKKLWDALVEIDTYLANDPDVWRIVSVCKAGEVLCDVLGAKTIRTINASVQANLCAKCGEELDA